MWWQRWKADISLDWIIFPPLHKKLFVGIWKIRKLSRCPFVIHSHKCRLKKKNCGQNLISVSCIAKFLFSILLHCYLLLRLIARLLPRRLFSLLFLTSGNSLRIRRHNFAPECDRKYITPLFLNFRLIYIIYSCLLWQ